jgi:hypothetical protein
MSIIEKLNPDMIGGIIRALLPTLIAYLIGAGILPIGDYSGVVAASVALATAAWSIKTNQSGKVIP